VWAAPTGTFLRSIRPRHGSAYRLAIAPTGDDLAIATAPMYGRGPVEVILVDVRTGRQKRVLASPGISLAQMHFSPDGRTLATAEYNGGPFRLWEVATGKERHRFDAHINAVYGMAFSGDGALLAASSIEAPAYVWDIYTKYGEHRQAEEWSAAQKQRIWQDLLDPDARIAFQAIRRLVRNPGPSVKLLHHYLKPAEPIDPQRVQQLLRDLDSDDFDQRQKSYTALEKLGGRLEAQLQATLAQRPSLELKRRVELLLEKLDQPTPERVRVWRAVEALEQTATQGAVDLLKSLAGGPRGAHLTRAASAALKRLR
jgi:WD40 repeat protein